MKKQKLYNAKDLYLNVRDQLYPLYSHESEILTYILLQEYLGIDKMSCIVEKRFEHKKKNIDGLNRAINRLKKNEPIQYIIGKANFFDREFMVKSGILIPRQETEELIVLVKDKNKNPSPYILDIGCGSGCIAITLALEISGSKIHAIDSNKIAVKFTQKNAQQLGAEVKVFLHDIFTDNLLNDEYDIIVSNPPYVTESDKLQMKKNVIDYEPAEALFVSDNDPLKYYIKILEISDTNLKNDGYLFFEVNEAFGHQLYNLLISKGFENVEISKDIHGKDRFVSGKKIARTF